MMTTGERITLPAADHPMWIDGVPVESASGRWRDSIDPYTGEVWARVAEGGPEDVGRAVQAARTALESGPWSRMTGRDRR